MNNYEYILFLGWVNQVSKNCEPEKANDLFSELDAQFSGQGERPLSLFKFELLHMKSNCVTCA